MSSAAPLPPDPSADRPALLGRDARALPTGDVHAVVARLAEHPFLAGISRADLERLARGGALVELDADRYVFRQGEPGETFTLLLEGDVDLEVAGAGPPLVLESLHAGDALGWSWLFPPHRWAFDAHCRTPVRAIVLDAGHLRALIDDDPVLGRELTRRVAELVADRLRHARLQIVSGHAHDHRA